MSCANVKAMGLCRAPRNKKKKRKKAKTGDLEIIFKINIIISPG